MSLTPCAYRLSPEDAAHFLRRTAYGPSDTQIRALVGQDAHTAAGNAPG